MPPDGYPIVLYAHGTGGDFTSYVDDGTGEAMAKHCLATMGVDQIFQGTRPGSVPGASEAEIGLTFYNVSNPVAARTNGRQSAIDEVQRTRLFTESHLVVPASISVTQSEISFDATRMVVFGHSQGGLNIPLFTAVDPAPLGGVFSGSGAEITIGLLLKTSPQPAVASLIATLLGLSSSDELDAFHPTMSLFQTVIDVEDPINYARLQAREPRPGSAPRSVYMTEGINPDGTGDTYAPPPTIEAHGLAVGLPLQVPFQHAIPQLAWAGPTPVMVPAAGLARNLAGGMASGILAQWAVPPGDDGHFVVFDVPAAQEQAAQFNQNLAANPAGLVPAP
jgi:predicted esterase